MDFFPLGYKASADKTYEIDPLTAPIVREIFERYADGETVAEISEALDKGQVFVNCKFKFSSKSSMHNLLKNRRYIGEYRSGDYVKPDGMPAIVPQELFDKVQARMARNRHTPASQARLGVTYQNALDHGKLYIHDSAYGAKTTCFWIFSRVLQVMPICKTYL